MDPNSEGPLYCAEQIKIPGKLPDILKEFTKAAIRTQPSDLLQWSTAYFEALQEGDIPPVKNRLEPSLLTSEKRLGGLSKGVISILHKQLGSRENIPISTLKEKWEDSGCDPVRLEELLIVGDFTGEEVEWKKMLALCCTALNKTLPEALTVLCEILSPDLEGGPARIDLDLFEYLYRFLATLGGEISKNQMDTVMEFLSEESKRFHGTVGPRDFLHSLCPKLD